MINSKFVATILLQVILFFIFLTVFFFTYTVKQEQNILITQIQFIINETVGPFLKFLNRSKNDQPPTTYTEIYNNIIEKINSINISKDQDKEVSDNNKKVIQKTTKILTIISIIVLFLVFVLWIISNRLNNSFFKSFNLLKIIGESSIILLFVAITEFIFLKFFASKFITIDINELKAAILEKVKDYLYPEN